MVGLRANVAKRRTRNNLQAEGLEGENSVINITETTREEELYFNPVKPLSALLDKGKQPKDNNYNVGPKAENNQNT